MRAPITCCGPCGGPPLGLVSLPNDAPPQRAAWSAWGYLCDDCAWAYACAVAAGDLLPGQPPTPKHVHRYGKRPAWA